MFAKRITWTGILLVVFVAGCLILSAQEDLPDAVDDIAMTYINTSVKISVLDNDIVEEGLPTLFENGISNPQNGKVKPILAPAGDPCTEDYPANPRETFGQPIDLDYTFSNLQDCDNDLPTSPREVIIKGTLDVPVGYRSWLLISTPDEEGGPKVYPQRAANAETCEEVAMQSGEDFEVGAYFGRAGVSEAFYIILAVVVEDGDADTTFKTWVQNGCERRKKVLPNPYPGFLLDGQSEQALPDDLFIVHTLRVHTRASTSIEYEPNKDFIGEDVFTYIAEDSEGNPDTATVTVIVKPLPPTDEDSDDVSDDDDQCPNTPPGESVDAVGCSDSQKDDDNDGVSNALDLCPDTPPGTVVDATGCPDPEVTPEPGTGDADWDGIPDRDDACPYEGDWGLGLDETGCPYKDTDGDGVFDRDDACPWRGNEGGPGVDDSGCPYYDADWDGVYDRDDACPRRGSENRQGVDETGCPISNEGNPGGESNNNGDGNGSGNGEGNANDDRDADWDGIPDAQDACPYEGDWGLGLDDSGCPYKDTDGDGVFDRDED